MIGRTLGISCPEEDQMAVALIYLLHKDDTVLLARALGEGAEKLSSALIALPEGFAYSLAAQALHASRGAR